MNRKCVEITTKNTRCKNDVFAGAVFTGADICMFHMRKKLKEVNQEFAALEGIAQRDIRAFWKIFGTVMGSAAAVFLLCWLASWYLGTVEASQW